MRTLSDDDHAVSPVIGVILMVAITVLLAATAAVFFLQFSQDQNGNGPQQAVFDVEYETGGSEELEVSHQTGDTLEAGNVEIVISGAEPTSINGRYSLTDSAFGYGATSDVSGGQIITLDKSTLPAGGSDINFQKATVKVVYAETSGATSNVLRKWTGPDA